MEEKKKKGRPTKKERGERKLRDALKGGARLAETSLSKLLWDFGSKKVVISENQRLDYQIIWALHCASDSIARDEWANRMMGSSEREKIVVRDEREQYLVIIPYKKFKKFVGRDITIKEAKEIFGRIPDVTLSTIGDGIILPFGGGWGNVSFYKDNICGVAFAKRGTYEEHRSDEKIERGRTAGTEEPVFILLFSNDYGRAFVEGAKNRWGTRLQYPEVYQLDPRAQELYESIRWNTGIVIRNMERISLVVGWQWPLKGKQQIYKRKRNCQKLIDILYESGFITRQRKRGKGEKSEWLFYVRKVKGILNEKKENQDEN